MKATKTSRRHTESDMRTALHRYTAIEEQHLRLRSDDDHPREVLSSVIDELLELRAFHEKVKGFVFSTYAEMQRR